MFSFTGISHLRVELLTPHDISELRAELQLPASGLLNFKYPDLFPALSFPPGLENTGGGGGGNGASPAPGASIGGGDMATHQYLTERELWAGLMDPSPSATASLPGTGDDGYAQIEEERSWLYYLAEISLRNIMNRVLVDLYGDAGGEAAWLADVPGLVKRHLAYSEELELW